MKSNIYSASFDSRASGLLEKKAMVDGYLRQSSRELSAFTFVNIFSWKDFFQFDFRIIDDQLCVFAHHPTGCFLYLPPLGQGNSGKAAEECFRTMRDLNRGSGVTRIENVPAELLADFPQSRYDIYQKGVEYCYSKNDIAGLRGNSYKSKRAEYNHFVSHYSFEYLPFEPIMIDECLKLYEDWSGERKFKNPAHEVYQAMLDENRCVHEVLMRHFKDLDLVGRVVVVDGKIKAYTFGVPLNERTFCVLVEVCDLSVQGLPTFIFREFCRDGDLAKHSLINVMDDFELENVRRTKMSFRPSVLIPSFVVKSSGAKAGAI